LLVQRRVRLVLRCLSGASRTTTTDGSLPPHTRGTFGVTSASRQGCAAPWPRRQDSLRQRIFEAPVQQLLQSPKESTMKKVLILALAPLAFAISAQAAAGTDTAVTTSTDPAKAAAVEHHAQDLATRDTKPAAVTEKTKLVKVVH